MLGSSGLSKPFASHGRNSKAIPSMPIPAALHSRASKGRIRAATRWLTPSLTGSTLRTRPGYARKDHCALSGRSHWKEISAGTAWTRDGERTDCSAILRAALRTGRTEPKGQGLSESTRKPQTCPPRSETRFGQGRGSGKDRQCNVKRQCVFGLRRFSVAAGLIGVAGFS
jgi:hypothetical protein